MRWIFDNLLWDATGTPRGEPWRVLLATRKLVAALAGATLLTWMEWVKHHPPEIVIVAVMHFVVVFAAVALLVYVGQWFRRNKKLSE
jgi:hypothetical protein